MLTYQMDRRQGLGKTAFLYRMIKEDIIRGTLGADERLPSKRALAEHLGISVITVENAYAMLEEEGYIRSRPRSGYYVNKLSLQENRMLSKKTLVLLEEDPDAGSRTGDGDYGGGQSPESSHPYYPAFARIMRRILSERPEILEMKPPHLGCAVLRNAIAVYLRRYRGMEVQPGNVIIGSGAEYLYGLIVQLLGRDIYYGIEDPSYEKIALVYKACGARVEPLEMGEDGIKTSVLEKAKAGALHVTPFHSFPTGITAAAEKRYEYLSWASKRDAYIIEDDFDSEFAAPRKPIETLYSMDREQRVIYLNTFSKSIAPSIRIGYMVLPETLLEEYTEKLGFYSCTVPVIDQYVLAAFINEGSFERHLNRIRRTLREKE